jgi:hypothetical protein
MMIFSESAFKVMCEFFGEASKTAVLQRFWLLWNKVNHLYLSTNEGKTILFDKNLYSLIHVNWMEFYTLLYSLHKSSYFIKESCRSMLYISSQGIWIIFGFSIRISM